jgi:hypothetical protein
MDHAPAGGTGYFATYNITEEWINGGQSALMSFWHRPLHAMTDAFTAAGFRLAVISEPQAGRRRRSYSSGTSRCTSPTSLIRWGAVWYR